jgi:hypothetical protein
MKKLGIATFGLIILLSGCTVLSFYPFYTQEVLVQNQKLIGKWKTYDSEKEQLIWEINFPDSVIIENEETNWEEKKVPNMFTYMLNCYKNDKPEEKVKFRIHLFKLKDQLFLDFIPENWEIENEMLAFHLMPTHTVAKINLADSLDINWMEPEWFDELIKEKKTSLQYEKNGSSTLLTSNSEGLKKFIEEYAIDKGAWKDGVEYNFCRYEY